MWLSKFHHLTLNLVNLNILLPQPKIDGHQSWKMAAKYQ